MKRFAAWMLLLALLVTALGCGCAGDSKNASPNEDGRPLLWKVTDTEGHTAYLFGTIHVGDERSDAVLTRVSPVLERCDALAVEFDLVAYQNDLGAATQSMMQFLLTDGTTIEDHMPKELYDRAYELLKKAGLFPDLMKSYNVSMWAQLAEAAAIQLYSELDSERAMDMLLLNFAYEKKIPVLEVESAEFQMDLLNNMGDEAALAMIETTLDSAELYGASLELMYRMWLSGDRELFWTMIAAGETDDSALDNFSTALIDERNVGMAEKVKEYLKSGKTVFFAVGAAHMANEAGVVQLLTDAGFTVEEVSY